MSREGSKRKQIWHRISKNNKIFKSCLLRNKQDIIKADFDLLNQSKVIIAYTNIKLAWMSNICLLYKLKNQSHNVLVSMDPTESLVHFKTAIKRRIPDSEGNVNRFNRVDRILNSLHEMGLHEKAHKYQAFSMLEGKPVPKGIQDKLREFMSNVVQTPHPDFSNKKMTEFASLFIYYIFAVLVILVVFFVENFVKVYWGFKS